MRNPEFELYKIASIIVQAKRLDNGHWHVVLPDGTEVLYGSVWFEQQAVKVDDADNR